MAIAKRVIVHDGFHKTGTTTVQKALRQDRKILRDHVHIILPDIQVQFYFSARAATPWLASCYAQHLNTWRNDLDTAAQRMAKKNLTRGST